MKSFARPLPPLTDEEEAKIQAGIAHDPDNPEWTEEDFAKARPFAEVFPELAASFRREREALDEAMSRPGDKREIVSLVLDAEVADKFRALGDDWKERVHEVLKKAKV